MTSLDSLFEYSRSTIGFLPLSPNNSYLGSNLFILFHFIFLILCIITKLSWSESVSEVRTLRNKVKKSSHRCTRQSSLVKPTQRYPVTRVFIPNKESPREEIDSLPCKVIKGKPAKMHTVKLCFCHILALEQIIFR
jgi:hypothetical protein